MRFPKLASVLALACLSAAFPVGMLSTTAQARPLYLKQFSEMYPEVKEAAVVKCGVCHIGAPGGKKWNDYGTAFGKTLGGANVKQAQAVQTGLKKTEGEKGTAGMTFGDLLKEGKLPASP